MPGAVNRLFTGLKAVGSVLPCVPREALSACRLSRRGPRDNLIDEFQAISKAGRKLNRLRTTLSMVDRSCATRSALSRSSAEAVVSSARLAKEGRPLALLHLSTVPRSGLCCGVTEIRAVETSLESESRLGRGGTVCTNSISAKPSERGGPQRLVTRAAASCRSCGGGGRAIYALRAQVVAAAQKGLWDFLRDRYYVVSAVGREWGWLARAL